MVGAAINTRSEGLSPDQVRFMLDQKYRKTKEIKQKWSTGALSGRRNKAINNFDNDFIASQQPKSIFWFDFFMFLIYFLTLSPLVWCARCRRSFIFSFSFAHRHTQATHTIHPPSPCVLYCKTRWDLAVSQFTNDRVPTVFASAMQWASNFHTLRLTNSSGENRAEEIRRIFRWKIQIYIVDWRRPSNDVIKRSIDRLINEETAAD